MINSNTMHPASCPKWVLRETGKNEIFWSMNPKSFCGALRESFCWFSRGKIFTFKLKASAQYSSNLISFWGNEVEQSSSLSSRENLLEQAELTISIYERKEFPSSELKYPRRFLGVQQKTTYFTLSPFVARIHHTKFTKSFKTLKRWFVCLIPHTHSRGKEARKRRYGKSHTINIW